MSRTAHVWQASDARNNFPEVMKQALTVGPQAVRHRNGEEVVVLSRREYDALRPNLKDFLVGGGSCGGGDELEDAIARNRSQGVTMFGRVSEDGK